MTFRIDGATTAPGFNGVGTINLNDYQSIEPRKQNDASFLYYATLDLSNIDENDPEMWNIAIRDDQNTEERIQSMQDRFMCFGYSTSYPPACMGTDGKIRD